MSLTATAVHLPNGLRRRPAVGGVFSTPASRWPRAFRAEFWETYPYFLPCVIAACISMSGFVLALCGLKEVCALALLSFGGAQERHRHYREQREVGRLGI